MSTLRLVPARASQAQPTRPPQPHTKPNTANTSSAAATPTSAPAGAVRTTNAAGTSAAPPMGGSTAGSVRTQTSAVAATATAASASVTAAGRGGSTSSSQGQNGSSWAAHTKADTKKGPHGFSLPPSQTARMEASTSSASSAAGTPAHAGKKHMHAAQSVTNMSQSASAASNRPWQRRKDLMSTIDSLTLAYLSDCHARGVYCGPITAVYEHIVSQPAFLDAVGPATGGRSWSAQDIVHLCTVAGKPGTGKTFLNLPPRLHELKDLLEQVDLFLSCVVCMPCDTLHDVSVELPRYLTSKSQPYVQIDSQGRESKGWNPLERWRWNFSAYDELRLGRLENHPTVRSIFRPPSDLRVIPSISKLQLLEFTSTWLPSGEMVKLTKQGLISEQKFMAALAKKYASKIKQVKESRAQTRAPPPPAVFTHEHPLEETELQTEWVCAACCQSSADEVLCFRCAACDLSVHRKCVASSRALLTLLPQSTVASLQAEFGPPAAVAASSAASSSSVVSAPPVAPDDDYLCVYLSPNFHLLLKTVKRVRYLSRDFQDEYIKKQTPIMRRQIEERCDAQVRGLFDRLAKQLQPTEQYYREVSKKMKTLMMEMDLPDESAQLGSDQRALMAAAAGAPDEASAALQRSFVQRHQRVECVRKHVERQLKLVDARGDPILNTSPLASLYRLLASAVPLLMDLVSDRILFVSDPRVVREAEQKRQDDIAARGGERPESPVEDDDESSSDDEQQWHLRARQHGKKKQHKAEKKKSGIAKLRLERDPEAAHVDDDDEDDGDWEEQPPRPYAEASVRAHMHQLEEKHAAAGASRPALSVLTAVRELQQHLWQAYCILNTSVDESSPPSLFDWLATQSDALQSAVDAWAVKAAKLEGKHTHADAGVAAAKDSKPVYTRIEVFALVAEVILQMSKSSLWITWTDEFARASAATSSSSAPTAPEVVLSSPAARRRVARAVELHFGVSDVALLGFGSLTDILEELRGPQAARLFADRSLRSSGFAGVALVPLVSVLSSSPSKPDSSRLVAASALPVPLQQLWSQRDALAGMRLVPTHRSVVHQEDAAAVALGMAGDVVDVQRRAIAALVRVPMLADASVATQWDLAFAPRLGRIEQFVSTYQSEIIEAQEEMLPQQGDKDTVRAGVLFLQISAGGLVRLDPHASIQKLSRSGASPSMCALQLVSLLVLASSLQDMPLEDVAATCHSLLESMQCDAAAVFILHVISITCMHEALRVMLCEMLLPIAAAALFSDKSAADARASLYALLLTHARSRDAPAGAQHALHRLGLQLEVPTWLPSWDAQSSEVQPASADRIRSEQPMARADEALLVQTGVKDASSVVESTSSLGDDTAHDAAALRDDESSSDAASSPAASSVSSSLASSALSSSPSALPRDVIAGIRKARGLDEAYLSTRTAESSAVDAAKNKLISSALELLSKELYQSDCHWVWESLQNADDNTYRLAAAPMGALPTLVFRLSPSDLCIINNEVGFGQADVLGICGLGSSTKGGAHAAPSSSEDVRGRIGHKGIGFKSVYVVSNSPQIFSNGFQFQLGITDDDGAGGVQDRNLGMLSPLWIEDSQCPPQVPLLKQRFSAETLIRLPLKPQLLRPAKQADVPGSAWNSMRHQFIQLLEPSLLLFLRQVRCLVLEHANDAQQAQSTASSITLRRLPAPGDIVEISESHTLPGVDAGSGVSHTHRFLMVRLEIPIPPQERVQFRWANAPPRTELACAFPLDQAVAIQSLFSFLPVRPYGFKFILQADFLLPSSRDSLLEQAPRNLWLFAQIPKLMPLILAAFKRHVALGTPGVSLLNFFLSLPVASRAEGDFGCLRGAAQACMEAVKQLPAGMDDAGRWVKPSALFFSSHAAVRHMLPSSLLGAAFQQRTWLHPSLHALSDSLKLSLGMQEFGAAQMLDLLRYHCQHYAKTAQKATASAAAASHRTFLARALHVLQLLLAVCPEREALLSKLQTVPVFPLEDDSFVAMQPERPLMYREQTGSNAGNAPTAGVQGAAWRQVLEGNLRILHDDVFRFVPAAGVASVSGAASAASNFSRVPSSSSSTNMVRQLLSELNVSSIDEHTLFQQAVNKLRTIAAEPADAWAAPTNRAHAHATLACMQQHVDTCTNAGCTAARKQIQECALVELADGSIDRLENVRSRLIVGMPYVDTKLTRALAALRAALPTLPFVFLSGVYLQASVQQAEVASHPDVQALQQHQHQWTSFLLSEFGIGILPPVVSKCESMPVAQLRLDARVASTSAVFQMNLDVPEVLLMDFFAPTLQAIIKQATALPVSPLLAHARIAMEELLACLAEQWDALWAPYAYLRVRRNVTDQSLESRTRDVTLTEPSAFAQMLRDAAWIPQSRILTHHTRSMPPDAFLSPHQLFHDSQHNLKLLPPDTLFINLPAGSGTDRTAFLAALGIDARVSAVRLYHLLVNDWSQRQTPFFSSLHRMADVYKYLKQHGSESIDFESDNSGHARDARLQRNFALSLPDSASVGGGTLIRDIFEREETRAVVWLPLPTPGVSASDVHTTVGGRWYSPHQFVLFDSKPEILNFVSHVIEWYELPAGAPMFVHKQAYKEGNSRAFWSGIEKTPYLERLTRALAAYVDRCVGDVQRADETIHQRDRLLDDVGVPRSDPLLVQHLCSWRRYISTEILSRSYAASDAEARQERAQVKDLLHSARMFPCFRAGEDTGRVHFVSLQQQPLLVDDVATARRFLSSDAVLTADDTQPLFFIIFMARGEFSMDAQEHTQHESHVWEEYQLRKLSSLVRQKQVVETASTPCPATLLVQLRRVVAGLQRFLLSLSPHAQRQVSASDLPARLAALRVQLCTRVEEQWQVEGVSAPPQRVSVLLQASEQRLCVKERDLAMDTATVMAHIVDALSELVAAAVAEEHRTASLAQTLRDFVRVIVPHASNEEQMQREIDARCAGARLPDSEAVWTFAADNSMRAELKASSAAAAPVRRVMQTESASLAGLFGTHMAAAPASLTSGGQAPGNTHVAPVTVTPAAAPVSAHVQQALAAMPASVAVDHASSGSPPAGESTMTRPAPLASQAHSVPHASSFPVLAPVPDPAASARSAAADGSRPAGGISTAGVGVSGATGGITGGGLSHVGDFTPNVSAAGIDHVTLVAPEASALLPEQPLPAPILQLLQQGNSSHSTRATNVITAGAVSSPPSLARDSALDLAHQMSEWAHHFRPAVAASAVSDSLDPSGDVAAFVGRWGEALCFLQLQHEERERHAAAPDSPQRTVRWHNEFSESGLPYDVSVGDGDEATLIEVKSTVHADRRAIDISASEVATALHAGDRYQLWRVAHAGNLQAATVQRIQNPAAHWHRKAIRVVMILGQPAAAEEHSKQTPSHAHD